MASDKKTIGITKANGKLLMELVAAGHFGSELDAAKFAMAHAIKSGVKPGGTEGAEHQQNAPQPYQPGEFRPRRDRTQIHDQTSQCHRGERQQHPWSSHSGPQVARW